MASSSSLQLTHSDLETIFRDKYGQDESAMGWGPRTRCRFGYFTPDDYYEATVSRLVTGGCAWLDVGSGRNVFPSNRKLARLLAQRCGLLVGLDPDSTIDETGRPGHRVHHQQVVSGPHHHLPGAVPFPSSSQASALELESARHVPRSIPHEHPKRTVPGLRRPRLPRVRIHLSG